MKFYKSYIQYKRNGKIIVEQLGDSIYPFKGRYTSLYYQIEMGKNEYKLYGYWQISSNEIECDTIIINENGEIKVKSNEKLTQPIFKTNGLSFRSRRDWYEFQKKDTYANLMAIIEK